MKRFLNILLLCCLIAGSTGTLQASEKSKLRIASYNLRMNTPKDMENAWPNRKDMVSALIQYHDFDIIGTQEAFKEMLDDITTSGNYIYTGKGREDGLDGGEHSAILYKKDKLELMDSGDFWYSETPDIPGKGWDAECCNRICSWAKFKDLSNGQIFYFFNSHFDHQGKIARRESSKLLLKQIKAIAQNAPVFCTGDLNATPDSEPIQLILSDSLLKDSRGLSETAPYGPTGTFQGFKTDAPMKNRIDYVFVTDQIQVHKYGVLTDIQDNRFPSDHCPVVVDVSF